MEITPEMMETINKVIAIQAPCYKVVGFDLDDIKQESFIICMKILEKWDGVRPLENYLSFSLSNKLKTLVRDKHKLQGGFADINYKIMSALDIDNIDWDNESSLISDDTTQQDMEYKDLIGKIDEYLPISLRRDYLLMKDGVHINRGRQKKIREYITMLIKELNGNGDDEDSVWA